MRSTDGHVRKSSSLRECKKSKERGSIYGHRSSLRRAIRESLRDASAAAAVTTSVLDSIVVASTSLKSSSRSYLHHPLKNRRKTRPCSTSSSASSILINSPSPSSSSPTSSALSSAEPATPVRSDKSKIAQVSRTTDKSKEGSPLSSSAQRKGWHCIKEIVGEGRDRGDLVYLVEWEGSDPRSGTVWPSSWVSREPSTFGMMIPHGILRLLFEHS